MKRLSDSLSARHDALDGLLSLAAAAARAEEWPSYRARLAAMREELLDHMSYEEEELFPALARGGLDRQEIALLERQHAKLRMQLDTLAAAAPQFDPEGCIAELESLAELQREHHARELAACYPQAEAVAVAPPAARAVAARAPLDLRGLQPPEPIVRIFEALEREPRTPLRAILPHEPVPLYGLLRERGFGYTGTPRPDGGFEVLIEPA